MEFNKILSDLFENHQIFEEDIEDMLTTIFFRLEKNHYHYDNIKEFINKDTNQNISFIYFELESLIINLRSTLDAVLQFINKIYDMNLPSKEINIKKVVTSSKCTPILKDLFYYYTNYNNKFWNFIYNTRNEIVHEICIKNKLPIIVEETYDRVLEQLNKTVYFINLNNDGKERLLFFYNECIKLIDDMVYEILNKVSKNYT